MSAPVPLSLSVPARRPPPPEYDSGDRRAPMLAELLHLLRFRDLLGLLVTNGIKARYKRSLLGVVWTLLNPIVTMLVMSVAFSRVFSDSAGHYPVYVLSGLLLWNFFSQSTATAMHSLVWGSGGQLIKRVRVPRSIFCVSAVGSGLVNLLLGLVPLALALVLSHQRVSWSLLFVPVAILLTALFVLGAALFLSTLAVFFADVVDMFQVLTMVWFYLTPVIYPRSILPPSYAWLLRINPMYDLLESFRCPIYLGRLPDAVTFLGAVAWALGSLMIGGWLFTRKADELSYRA
jgi:ABC-type polysaccharide/polyol phosphate export permease